MATKNNGRPVNALKSLKNGRGSPYSDICASRTGCAPGAVSLPEDKVHRCLATIELALRRSNREEAIAAVNRAFREEERAAISADSYLEELGLGDKIVETLNSRNIATIRDLLLGDSAALYAIVGLSESEVNTVILSVESHGFRFLDSEDDF